MSKRYSVLITALFCVFIFGFGILFFLMPDRDFSQQENRYLDQFTAPTWETLKTGAFMEDFEDYMTDQFPLRDSWTRLKAWGERLLGKQENNGVYLGTEETLFAQFDPDLSQVEKNLAAVNSLTANVDVPVYFSLIPDKTAVWADRLPDNAPLVDDGSIAALAQSSTSAVWVDVASLLATHAEEPLYYRTDHHWTTTGAWYGYAALADALGLEAVPLSAYEKTTVSTDFYGTTWSSAGTGWITPDSIELFVPEESVTVTSWASGSAQPGELYVDSFLSQKDKYSMFLGGNSPLMVLSADNDGPKVLIIRDSYCDSMAPFLAANCSEVHLFDPRYNRSNVPSYVAEHDIDAVVVLYSAANFVSDQNVFLIGLPAPQPAQ